MFRRYALWATITLGHAVGEPELSSCEVRPCVVVGGGGFEPKGDGSDCLWCGGSRLELQNAELFALAGFAEACALSGTQIVRPQNNWCLGRATPATPYDREESAGCFEGLITDPCTGFPMQVS
jgi:hypothetical protein